jgi:small-conductance mechanosensitive channel
MAALFTADAWDALRQDVVLYLPRLVSAVLVLLAFWAVAWGLARVIRRLAARGEADPGVIKFVVQIVQVAVWTFAIVTALGTLGVDVAALVGGLGLTGFALGFALKDIISNVLAGMLLLIYRPFRRGERIKVSGWEGIVADIDLRYTTRDTTAGRVLIPNANLFTTPVELLDRGQAEKTEKTPQETTV